MKFSIAVLVLVLTGCLHAQTPKCQEGVLGSDSNGGLVICNHAGQIVPYKPKANPAKKAPTSPSPIVLKDVQIIDYRSCDGVSCWHGNTTPADEKALLEQLAPTKDHVQDADRKFTALDCLPASANNHTECDLSQGVTLVAPDASSVVKLANSEYAHLQELRQAVVDEEKRLALKYGLEPDACMSMMTNPGQLCVSHHYEYLGQFLFITRAK